MTHVLPKIKELKLPKYFVNHILIQSEVSQKDKEYVYFLKKS